MPESTGNGGLAKQLPRAHTKAARKCPTFQTHFLCEREHMPSSRRAPPLFPAWRHHQHHLEPLDPLELGLERLPVVRRGGSRQRCEEEVEHRRFEGRGDDGREASRGEGEEEGKSRGGSKRGQGRL